VLRSTSSIVTQACGRSGIAAFNAIAEDDILSRCSISFEVLSIVVDVQAFFAGDEHALEVELWGLWQVCGRADELERVNLWRCWKIATIGLSRLMNLQFASFPLMQPSRHRLAVRNTHVESKHQFYSFGLRCEATGYLFMGTSRMSRLVQ
jgi:hypothetical protein